MKLLFNLAVYCETSEALSQDQAMVMTQALRLMARELNSKVSLVMHGVVRAAATVIVDDGAEIHINLGDQPDENRTDEVARRIAKG